MNKQLTPESTPQEVRAAWADRLEANPERQGKNCLAPTLETRCCLGELCDMAVEAGVTRGYELQDGDLFRIRSVREWVGLRSPGGSSPGMAAFGYRSLVGANDLGGTWPEIAAIIRAEPDGLFVD